MTKYILLMLSLVLMSIGMAFGVDEVAVPGQALADKILEFISSGTGAMVLAAIVEFALRFVKSEKPLGILHAIGGILKVFGNLAYKLGEFLDKILPQKTKK